MEDRTRVILFSRDAELARLCRDVLEETLGTEWTLAIGTAGQATSTDCLCIWDLNPGELFIPDEGGPAELKRHFLLLDRSVLPDFLALPGARDSNVLLKPVTRASLRAFLSGAVGRSGPREGAQILRAERDEMLQFLIHANLKLQEYDQERTNFLARSIHDFRAPLTAIEGYCGLLLEGELGPLTPEQREVLERMQKSGGRLARISDAMFQLSTDQRIDETPRLEAADLRDCVDQALYELGPFMENKRIAVKVDIAPPPVGLLFEKTQLQQTLLNLLENACKFTPRAGSIEIKGYPFFWERRIDHGSPVDPSLDRRVRQLVSPNAFRVDIRDSGPALPSSHVNKIFEEYTSYSGGEDRSGAGLGLAICRMILQRHQGRIWAQSNSDGTEFSFVLPIRSPLAQVDRATPL